MGQYDSEVSYSYEPETLIHLFPQVASAYREILDMPVYATIAQGVNEYADHSLLHRSTSGAHISLNSLGFPFAQLLSIDEAARSAIRSGIHRPYALYIDELFFHSLRFKYGFDKHAQPPSASCLMPMSSSPGTYYCTSADTILSNLDPTPTLARKKQK